MPEWVIPFLTAIGGAAIAITIRESIEWCRRPKLEINFEAWSGANPRLADFSLGEKVMGIMDRSRYLRLLIHNTGRKLALDCEAKVVVCDKEDNDSAVQSLHWSRRDPRIYKTLDQIYAPIPLNPRDNELLDVLELNYQVDIDTNELMNLPENRCIETISPYSIMLEKDKIYSLEVTIFASNATSKPFRFKIHWDGTIE